ncbi:MAG: hypothetical protein IPH12_12990 [Saprospirales bacterium]|jgi:hypothetical protein|nr:hypothetical protein [Saprospirales bacterium]MBK8921269.1 hypothetical protein [Saprospirales bacterium]
MKKILLISGLLAFAALYSCQKDVFTAGDLAQTDVLATDRGGDGHGPHHGGHPADSLHFDSLGGHHPHPHGDSLHFDSLGGHHPHHDSTWTGGPHPHDSTWTGGGHHGHGPHHGGGQNPPAGCQEPPALITVADLPPAAQDWLAANQAGATIESVIRITKRNCTVIYAVKIPSIGVIRFDADGNKIN